MSGLHWRGRMTLVVVGATFGWLSAGVGPGAPTRSAAAATARVEVGSFRFNPPRLQISLGDVVEWDAVDDGHTVTARDGSFDSSSKGLMGDGDYFRYRFRAPGTYDYYCRVHASRGMQGTIVVVDPYAPATSSTRLTPVTAAATTSTTAAATTTTTAPVTTTTRVLATSSTTSLAQAEANTAPVGEAAVPNEAPTMNPGARVVGSPVPEAGGLSEAQAAARRSQGGDSPPTGLLAGGGAGLLALLGIGAFTLQRRRKR